MWSLVFFNDTATTEIYTYCHTRSLHDALPVSFGLDDPRQSDRADGAEVCGVSVGHGGAQRLTGMAKSAPARMPVGQRDVTVLTLVKRSEEHTSELQSLMRISYAVFCLKKKKLHLLFHTQQKQVYVLDKV